MRLAFCKCFLNRCFKKQILYTEESVDSLPLFSPIARVALNLTTSLNLLLCSYSLSLVPELRIKRQNSSDSISSLNSITSHSSIGSSKDAEAKKKKKKSWVGKGLGPGPRRPMWTPSPQHRVDPARINQAAVPSSPKPIFCLRRAVPYLSQALPQP